MFLDSGRHVAARAAVLLMHGTGGVAAAAAEGIRHLGGVLVALYDVYVSIPLRIEASLRGANGRDPGERLATERRAPDTGALR
jgi:hypothetical protein